jgi:hypothetical protein
LNALTFNSTITSVAGQGGRRQVQEELPVAYEQNLLTAVEGEAGAELKQELLHVVDERLLQLALAGAFGEPEELEDVGFLVACSVCFGRRLAQA